MDQDLFEDLPDGWVVVRTDDIGVTVRHRTRPVAVNVDRRNWAVSMWDWSDGLTRLFLDYQPSTVRAVTLATSLMRMHDRMYDVSLVRILDTMQFLETFYDACDDAAEEDDAAERLLPVVEDVCRSRDWERMTAMREIVETATERVTE
jgi:hypothetical protein